MHEAQETLESAIHTYIHIEISEGIRGAGAPVRNSLRHQMPEAQEVQESEIDIYIPTYTHIYIGISEGIKGFGTKGDYKLTHHIHLRCWAA
jgi:hypothetical protein